MSERDDNVEQVFHVPVITPRVEEEFSPGPICCKGGCCGPGSYCCGHPDNVHEHEERRMDFENGKYTLIMDDGGIVTALRHGEPWREFIGDKFIGLLARKVFGLEDHE